MNQDPTLIFIGIAVAGTIYLAQRIYLKRSRLRKARTWLAQTSQLDQPSNEISDKSLFTSSKQFLTYLVLHSNYGVWLQNQLIRAGKWEHEDIHRLITAKFQSLLACLIGCYLLVRFVDLPILAGIPILALAFIFPDLITWDRARNRIKRITEAIPETIDLLGMCVTAGIGFHAGMQRVAGTRDNPLSEEFSRVLSEMKIGQGRTQALVSMSERLGIEPLEQFLNSVLQVDRLGIPMAKVLEEQSRRMRSMRREQAREHAQKLPVKILAPIMLFMLPALLIIVLGPAIVTIVRSFS